MKDSSRWADLARREAPTLAGRRAPVRRGAVGRAAVIGLALGMTGAVVGVGSAGSSSPDGHEGDERMRRGAPTSAGSFYLEWWPEPEPIPLNEVFTIRFRVLEPDDRRTLIAGAVVTASAWMPEHNHGTVLEPRIESQHDGTATASGFLLHMEGHWQLLVGVAVGAQMERVTFDIHLEP